MARLPQAGMATPSNVYFDDSGCNPKRKEPDFIWAGYWSTFAFWRKFCDAWNDILDRPPRLEYWHQAKAYGRKPPFDCLSDAQYVARRDLLFELIGDNITDGKIGFMLPLSVRVAHVDVASCVANKITFARPLTPAELERYKPTILERANFIALYVAAQMCDKFQDGFEPHEMMPLSMYCELADKDPYQPFMRNIWDVMRTAFPHRFATLDFPPGKCRLYPQLQAADVIAWHLNREAKNGKPEDTWLTISKRQLIEKTISKDDLNQYVARWNRIDPSDPRTFRRTGPP